METWIVTGDAVRIISAGGFYINHQRVTKIDEVLTQSAHILPNNVSLIRVGKQNTLNIWLFLFKDRKERKALIKTWELN